MSPVDAKKSPTPSVLIVDDEALIRWSLVESFAEAGYAVTEASDAATTLEQLAGGKAFDAVVLDYRLPDSNDLRLLEKVRTHQPRAAVVMMTAFGTLEMTDEAMKLGAYQVIAKPFDVHVMVELVGQARARSPR